MIAETDIRNKKQLIERKSMYSQLQSQIESLSEQMKDKDGTIETLERQLVQSGIRMKVQEGGLKVKDTLQKTDAEQKLLRNMMKAEFDIVRRDLQKEVKDDAKEQKDKQKKDFEDSAKQK